MNGKRVEISAGAILAAAVIYFCGDLYSVSAIVLPVAVHELAHIICLRFFGMRIQGFSFRLQGICICYSGITGIFGDITAAAAGPAAGLIYALAASKMGVLYDSPWLFLSSGVSLLLSIFNLLPVFPLDGGRMFLSIACALWGEKKGISAAAIVGTAIGIALLILGFSLIQRGQGMALALAAIWILLCQTEGAGIVKRRKVL